MSIAKLEIIEPSLYLSLSLGAAYSIFVRYLFITADFQSRLNIRLFMLSIAFHLLRLAIALNLVLNHSSFDHLLEHRLLRYTIII